MADTQRKLRLNISLPAASRADKVLHKRRIQLDSRLLPKMTLRDEQADILGGPILQRPESGVFAIFSRYHFVFKSVTLLGLGLLLWIACIRGLEHLKKHRELRYRKYVAHSSVFHFFDIFFQSDA